MDNLEMPLGAQLGERSGKHGALAYALATFGLCMAATPALAQNGERKDSVAADAMDAVTQPLSDLNIRSKDIPVILTLAQTKPYDLSGLTECKPVYDEIDRLDEVLGPDADAPPKEDGVVNKGLKIGGNVLGGFIPFRGLVRQISGANAERAKWDAAIYAGIARRSYLKGYAQGRGCPSVEEAALNSARDVLEMDR